MNHVEQSRPAGESQAAQVSTGGADANSVTDISDVPEFRSSAWWALDRDDWRRQTAVYVAANRWHSISTTPYGWDLLDEAVHWHGRKTFSDWSSAVAEAVKGRRLGPSYRELERRRAVLGPNYRPHPGGPVDFHTGELRKGAA